MIDYFLGTVSGRELFHAMSARCGAFATPHRGLPSPVRTLHLAVTVLSREGGGPGARAWDKPWRDARFSVERLERFVSNLELMNGLDRGTVDVQSGVFDFQRTAQEVVAGFAVEAAWKGVR